MELTQIPRRYRELLLELGVDLEERHGNAGWLIPMPATLVIDQSGVIRYALLMSTSRAVRSPKRSLGCCPT
jgi:peroxiredoxin